MLEGAGVGGLGAAGAAASGTDTTVRTSEVTALSRSQFKWVYDRMQQHLGSANADTWGYSYLGEMEDIQIARYSGERSGHYTWHPDAVYTNKYGEANSAAAHYGGHNRLLSASVQLSESDAYEGGDLQIGTANATRTRGTVVVFPSYQLHRVYPVLSGERYSLVVWMHGHDGAEQYWQDAESSYQAGATAEAEQESYTLAAGNSLGALYSSAGRAEEALPVYNSALQMSPADATTLNNLASAQMQLHRNSEAVDTFTRAIDLQPSMIWSLRGRGAALLRLGRGAESIADTEAALAISGPTDSAALLNLGVALYETKQHSAAVKALTQAVETGQLDPQGQTAAHVAIGKMHAIGKNNDEALTAANAAVDAARAAGTQALLSDPLQLRGLLRRNTGNLDGALADYTALVSMHPGMAQLEQVVDEIQLQIEQGKQ